MPSYPNAPSRRTPIRGLQFFVPATSWYCKLCSVWMGDLHCASLHLKSKCHSDSITVCGQWWWLHDNTYSTNLFN